MNITRRTATTTALAGLALVATGTGVALASTGSTTHAPGGVKWNHSNGVTLAKGSTWAGHTAVQVSRSWAAPSPASITLASNTGRKFGPASVTLAGVNA